MLPGLQKGKLTLWKDDRGFGFIQPVQGEDDIFIHISAIKERTRRPKVGDTICYYTVVQDGKQSARDAFIVGARRPPRDASAATQQSLARFPWKVFPIAALPVGCSLLFFITTDNIAPLALYGVMSVVTFKAYAHDKQQACLKRWRMPENRLHLLELAGGWPGALVAQKQLRHKSRKRDYQMIYWAIVGLHYVVWICWLLFS